MGCTESNHSSSHHRGTNQGQESSSSLVPPRPPPSAIVTSGTLAANSLGQGSGGATGQSGQGKRQPGEQDRAGDRKVRYSFYCSIENFGLCVCLNPCKGYSEEILLNYFVIPKGSCFKITFQQLFLNFEFIANVYYGSLYNFLCLEQFD